MGKASKRTKKYFQSGALDREIEARNKARPIKRKIKAKETRDRQEKRVRAGKAALRRDDDALLNAKPIENMSVDEFMATGFQDILDGNGESDDSDDGLDDLDDEVSAAAAAADDDEDDDDDDDEEVDEEDTASAGTVSSGAFAVAGKGKPSGEGEGEADESASDADSGDDESNLDATNALLGGEVGKHQDALERLKKAQPEFYKYLQDNDQSLLDFAGDGEDSGGAGMGLDDDSEEEANDLGADDAGDELDETQPKMAEQEQGELLTRERIAQWRKALQNNETKTFKKVVRALYEACASDEEKDALLERRFRVGSGATFNALIKCALKFSEPLLKHHLKLSKGKPTKGTPLPSTSKAWKRFKGSVKVYLATVLQMLTQLTDENAELFVLTHAFHLCPYYASFPKLNRAFFKKILHLWSHGAETVRVKAFLVMRQLVIVSPYPFIEIALKGIYLTFVRNCKFPTPSMRPTLNFMLNSVVELFRLDLSAAYQHAFVYIRQLAVHLRNALTQKKKDSVIQVYNWQYVYAVRVWAKLLSQTVDRFSKDKNDALRPLLYPLIQTTIGALKLVPTAKYFPLRFHLVRALVQIGESTGVYIHVSGFILDTLESAEMKRNAKPSSGKPIFFDNMLKCPKSHIDTKHFQDAVLNQVIELALGFYSSIAYSIGFPECVFPDLVRLRKFMKQSKAKSVKGKLRPLIEKLDENSHFITTERSSVTFSPKDWEQVQQWRMVLETGGKSPLARYCKVWRAAEKNRQSMMTAVQDVEGEDYEKATTAAAAKAKKNKAASRGEDSEEDEGGEDDDEGEGDGAEENAGDSDEEAGAFQDIEIAGGEDDVLADFAMSDFELDSD